jgi:M6 family metalloprotease-like protein
MAVAGVAAAADKILTGHKVPVIVTGDNTVRSRCLASPVTPRPLKGVTREHPWSLPRIAAGVTVADTLNVLVLRYNFQYESVDDPNTTGRGRMDFSRPLANPTDSTAYYNSVGHWIDPPPHNADYFDAHMKAMSRYWNWVSEGKIALKWDIYPPVNDSALLLNHPMKYYGLCDSVVVGLERFFEDGIRLADTVHNLDPGLPPIDFTKYDHIIMFHAGSDRQNDIGFPTTCSDMFTGFIKFGDSVPVNDSAKFIREALLMPETSCQDNRATALNAAFAHEFGHALGLVDLYNTANALSQLGDFSLMDDNGFGTGIDFGFNVGQVFGAIPIYPDAWSRAYLGYVPVVDYRQGTDIRIVEAEIASQGIKIARVPISENQYYLIENRDEETDGQPTSALVDALTGVLQGPIDSTRKFTGEYDFLIPGDGMLIYLVDEGVASLNYTGEPGTNNFEANTLQWDPSRKFITLIEGDGLINFGGYYRAGFGKPEDMYREDRNHALTPNSVPQALDNFHNDTRIYITNIHRDTVLEPGAVEYTLVDSVMRFNVETDKLASGFPVRVGYPKYGLSPIVDDLNRDGVREVLCASGKNLCAFTTGGATYLHPTGCGTCPNFIDSAFSSTNPGTPHSVPIFYRSTANFSAGPVTGYFASEPTHKLVAVGDEGNSVQILDTVDTNGDGLADVAGSELTTNGFPIAMSFGDSVLWTLTSSGWVYRRTELFVPLAHRHQFTPTKFKEFHGIAQIGNRLALVAGDTANTKFMVLTAQGTDSLVVDSISVSGRYNFGPIVVDMNRDGTPEIVAFSSTGDGICVSVDTSTAQPALSVLEQKSTGFTFTTNPVAGDLDLDGRADIAIGGTNRLYAFDDHLTIKSDFPKECGDRNPSVDIIAAPIVGQVDGTGGPEMVCPNDVGSIHAISDREIAGFPLNGGVKGAGSSLLFLDSTGGELGYVGADGWFYLWHVDSDSTKNLWPMGGHDPAGSFSLRQDQIGSVVSYADEFPKEQFYNYPNPATNGRTTIRYFLGRAASRVMLSLYDLSGRKVTEFDGTAMAGTNEHDWDCSAVTPGVYRCRIEVDFSGDTKTAFTDIAVIR